MLMGDLDASFLQIHRAVTCSGWKHGMKSSVERMLPCCCSSQQVRLCWKARENIVNYAMSHIYDTR